MKWKQLIELHVRGKPLNKEKPTIRGKPVSRCELRIRGDDHDIRGGDLY